MMALLLLIGQKLEAPEIINQLLDVQSNPRKPQYRWDKLNWIRNCDSNTAELQLHQYRSVLNTSLPVSSMAVDYPLVLYDCHFEGVSWRQDSEEVNHVLSALQQHWTQSAVKTHVVHGMIRGLEAIGEMFKEINGLWHFEWQTSVLSWDFEIDLCRARLGKQFRPCQYPQTDHWYWGQLINSK